MKNTSEQDSQDRGLPLSAIMRLLEQEFQANLEAAARLDRLEESLRR